MSSIQVIKFDGEVEIFDDTMGHQVGNGAVQVMMKNGEQHIFNNFRSVDVLLSEEEKADFLEYTKKAEAAAIAKMAAQEQAQKEASLSSVN